MFLGRLKQLANVVLLITMLGAVYTHYILRDKFERMAPGLVFSLLLLTRLIIHRQVTQREKKGPSTEKKPPKVESKQEKADEEEDDEEDEDDNAEQESDDQESESDKDDKQKSSSDKNQRKKNK